MLQDDMLFKAAEASLIDEEVLSDFIAENGEIETRFMIVDGNPPVDSGVEVTDEMRALIGSFDTTDCEVGIMFNIFSKQPSSGFWVVRQTEDAKPPSGRLIGAFADAVMKASYGKDEVKLPIFAFLAPNGEVAAYSDVAIEI